MIKKYHGNFILSVRSWQNYNYKKFNKNIILLKFQFKTTRKPRLNEVEGVDYFFVSIDKFKEMIQKKFYEHAEIFGNYYGTSRDMVDKTLKKNDIIFDIDWQGTKQLSSFKNLNLIKIFLITSNKADLKNS